MRLHGLRPTFIVAFLSTSAVAFIVPCAHAPGESIAGGVENFGVTRRSILATAAFSAVSTMSEAEPQQIRWGIIGAGDVCEKKSGPGFKAAKNSQLIAVMSRTQGKAKDFAERNGIPKSFENVDALLGDEEIDAVYVATPPGTHLELALKVVAAGKPCLLEKPMARNLAESKQIADAFEAAGIPLFVAYSSRVFPRTMEVKRLLDSGAIGELTAVSYRFGSNSGVRGLGGGELPWRLRAEQSGGGLIMDVGCHILDRLDMLCGPLTDVHGTAAKTGSASAQRVEDTVALTARLGPSGALLSAVWAFAAAEPLDELQLIGSAGTMTMPGGGPAGTVRLQREGAAAPEELTFPPLASNYLPIVERASAELLARARCTAAPPGEDGVDLSVASAVRTAAVLDTALEAYYGGRADAFWLREASWPGPGPA